MTENKLSKWSDRTWIKFGSIITAVITIVILMHWQTWADELKVIWGIGALIPVHVIEEWVFPGGFHYQYNTFLYHSKSPDRYPMCRVSDMITNLGATFLYIGLGLVCTLTGEVSAGILMGTIGFCCLEVCLHTVFGILAYIKFHGEGKTTIYGPGSITAYLGFGVFGTILFYCMQDRTITGEDWLIGICILAVIALVCILIPENLIKRKDSQYYFRTNGYFDRFLNK